MMDKAAEVVAEVVAAKKAQHGITSTEEFKKQIGENEELQKEVFESYMTTLEAKRVEILEKHNIDKSVGNGEREERGIMDRFCRLP